VQNDLEHELLELGDFYRERTTISQSLVIFPAKVRGRGVAPGAPAVSAALQVERRLRPIGGQFAQASSPSGTTF